MKDSPAFDPSVYVWAIVWQHPRGDWFVWDFVRARRNRRELFAELAAVKLKHPNDKFRLRKFAMVMP